MNFLSFLRPIASTMGFPHVAALRMVVSGILLMILTHAVIAQHTTAKPDPDTEVTRQLLERVEKLEARLRELEAKQASAAASESPVPTRTPATNGTAEEAADHPHSAGTTADGIPLETPKLEIKGYGDIRYQATDQKGRPNSFLLGQLDLFITSRLSEKLNVIAEIVIESEANNKVVIDLERLLLQYSVNDHLNLGVGRYHTAMGFYNTAYHHGTWFQTSIDRPLIFLAEDKGGILPMHNVGISAGGIIPSGKLGLRYIAEIANGRNSNNRIDEPVQNIADANNGKAFHLGFTSRPEWLPGVQAGFSVYRDRLHPAGLRSMGQTILAGHLVYLGSKYEILNEAVVVRHARGDRTFNIPGFYTQVARKFGNIQPYSRYQYLNVPRDEPIFKDLSLRYGPAFGVRYDFSEFIAFKAQYDRLYRRNLVPINKLALQLAFTF